MEYLLKKRMLMSRGDYFEDFTAPWLISSSDTIIQYPFSSTKTDVNYPTNITDYPSCLYFISKRSVSGAPTSVNVGAKSEQICRFCSRDKGWTNKFNGFLTSAGQLTVDGFYYSYFEITKDKFDSAVEAFTSDIAGGRIPRNGGYFGTIAMWRTRGGVLDKWVIESDTLNADIIRLLRPHT